MTPQRWQIMHGDCLELMKSLPNGSVSAVVTDIPYNEVNRDTAGLRNLDKGAADSAPVDLSLLVSEFVRLATDWVFVWCGIEQVSPLKALLDEHGTTRLLIWEKTNPSPMNGQYIWLSAIETCVCLRKSGGHFTLHCERPVFRGKIVSNAEHPTQKPVWLMSTILQAAVPPGGTALDPFAGSGSTGVACSAERLNFIGMEQDATYCEIARRRIEAAYAQGNLDLFDGLDI